MKTKLASALCLAALAVALTLGGAGVSAKDLVPADRAEDLLARQGSVPVTRAGPYVEVGTYLVQVEVKLGKPTAKLAEGTWVYRHYEVEGSQAAGSLVVRFNPRGRVSSLAIVTPAVATAMMAPRKAQDTLFVAANK
jgi:hypothetical protein